MVGGILISGQSLPPITPPKNGGGVELVSIGSSGRLDGNKSS